MKAYVVNNPFDAALCEVPIPSIHADEVLVQVGAGAICHSDLDIIEGRRQHAVHFPVVLGHEFAGTIAALGSKVTRLKIGQRVACECIVYCDSCRTCRNGETSCCENYSELGTIENGGFAEYVAVPARMVHPFYHISMEEAANIEPAGNGCHVAEAANIREGDTVVVIGPGPIGLYAMQFAALRKPAKLIMVGTRDSRLAVANKVGATHTINIRKEDPYEAIMKLTDGKGADRVLQCATTDDAVSLALRILGRNAVLAVEGYGSQTPMAINFYEFIMKPMAIVGVCGVCHSQFVETLRAAEAGEIDIKSLITHEFALSEIERAFDTVRDKSRDAIKVMIKP